MPSTRFALPSGDLVLETASSELLAIAGRIWEPLPQVSSAPASLFHMDVTDPAPPVPEIERDLRWTVSGGRFELDGGQVTLSVDAPRGTARGAISSTLLHANPSLAGRLLLETPAAIVLSFGAYTAIHAGAVCDSGKAVVVRGASGAGKSTLVAAAWRAGFDVLGDESILVHRTRPDELASSIRDITLLPEAVRLLRLEAFTQFAFSGGEAKRRIDLLKTSHPARRRARRIATVLIGPRDPGPARLVPLSPEEFVTEFRKGSIPEERRVGDPDDVARPWSRDQAFRLDGASDLRGAVEQIGRLLST